VPDFSTLSRRQKTLAVNIPYRGSKGPLHLLIDSTGIKVEGEWHAMRPCRHRSIWGGRSGDDGADTTAEAASKRRCIRVKLLGQSLRTRDFDRQVAEVQVRIAIMNGYTARGIPVTEAVG